MPGFLRAALSTADSGDVAVAMGPRNKRRLAATSVLLGGVAVVAAASLWFSGGGLPFVHWSHHSEPSSSTKRLIHSFRELIPYQAGLPYGMTRPQMIHRLGTPEQVAGQCLQYPENVVTLVGSTINAVRMCFFAGQYQGWFVEIDGVWKSNEGILVPIEPPTTVTAVRLNKTIPDWSKAPHE